MKSMTMTSRLRALSPLKPSLILKTLSSLRAGSPCFLSSMVRRADLSKVWGCSYCCFLCEAEEEDWRVQMGQNWVLGIERWGRMASPDIDLLCFPQSEVNS